MKRLIVTLAAALVLAVPATASAMVIDPGGGGGAGGGCTSGMLSEGNNSGYIPYFRSNTFVPANIPDGRYTVLAYLFSQQSLIAAAQSSFTVSKIGFEQTVASFAVGQSLIYGVLTVALSIFIGWLGGVIFRRD